MEEKGRIRTSYAVIAIVVVAVIIIAGVLTFTGAPKKEEENEPIKFGGVLPLTGGLAQPAKWIERSWKLWEERTNKAGGLLGRPVEVTVYDSELKTGKMKSLTTKLIEVDDVDILIGPYPTLSFPVMAPIAERHKMAMFSLFWPRSHILDKKENPDKWPYNFGFSAGTFTYPRAFLKFLNSLPEEKQPDTIAVAGRNDIYGRDGFATTKEWADQFGYEIVAKEYYDPSATDLTPLARKLKGKNPDVLMGNNYMGDAILLQKGAVDVGLHPDIIWHNVGPQVPSWIDALGEKGNYVFGSTPYTYSVPTPANQELSDIAQERWGARPNYGYGFGYIQMQVYAQAIEKAGSLDQEKIREAFETSTFDVITGELKFVNGFSTAPMYVTQVQGENIEVVWPEEFKTADPVVPIPPEWPE